jgi:hypothetical protein
MTSSWNPEKYKKNGGDNLYAEGLRRRARNSYHRNKLKPGYKAREAERQRDYRLKRKTDPIKQESWNTYMREYMRKYTNANPENYTYRETSS